MKNPKNSKKVKKTVIYARYSSKNQDYTSILAQIQICQKYAEATNQSVDLVIEDPEASGLTLNRPGLKELMAMVKNAEVEKIIIHKYDRLSRSTKHMIILEEQLKEYGVKLETVEGNCGGDTPIDNFTRGIVQLNNEFYSANLASEVKKSLYFEAGKGRVNGGTAPFGYEYVKGEKSYKINESEAIIVREIFSLYLAGNGFAKIIQRLDTLGYKTRRGKSFAKSSITNILKNQTYIGTYTYGKKSYKKVSNFETFDDKTKVKVNPKENIVVVEDAFEAIIDKVDFTRAQQVLVERNQNKANGEKSTAKNLYLLTNVLHCGFCGSIMVGNASTKGEYQSSYYACSNCRAKKKLPVLKSVVAEDGTESWEHDGDKTYVCDNRSVNKEQLEKLVLTEIVSKYFTLNSSKVEVNEEATTVLTQIVDGVNSRVEGDVTEVKSNIKLLQRRLKKLRGDLEKQITLDSPNAIKLLEGRIEDTEKELGDLRNILKATTNVEIFEVEKLAKAYLLEYLMIDDRREERKAVITSFIKDIVVFKDTVEIYFNDVLGTIHSHDREVVLKQMKSTIVSYVMPLGIVTHDLLKS